MQTDRLMAALKPLAKKKKKKSDVSNLLKPSCVLSVYVNVLSKLQNKRRSQQAYIYIETFNG